jgi:hypothetical protein
MCITWIDATFVIFIDPHPLLGISPARAARRKADAKETSSIIHLLSDMGSSMLEGILMLGSY